ncbi:hypothetical protein CMUST_09690 [Corynebacterium mustelae]|uniref:Uncharacterized protein n=1 Tax=Corynebacterium mustelae TaxID=571915 RepID=A0A0G3GYL7_9CORY|nr:hypothetical protein [Corynebacterium mustelae]AKK06254.1 hypothetical protein CMUST_09690 [Corynebacterium mustelae]
MDDVSVDVHVLLSPAQVQQFEDQLQSKPPAGFEVVAVYSMEENFSCEPDNMLVAQYEQRTGKVPVAESVYRIVVHGRCDRSLVDATAVVVKLLPDDALWYGTTVDGFIDPGSMATCSIKRS